MNATKISAVALGVVAAIGIGLALYQTRTLRQRDAALEALTKEQGRAQARTRELEQRITAASERAKAAEEDNAKLLQAIERAQVASKSAPVVQAKATSAPITRETVMARYTRGRDLVKSGNLDEALAELQWCYDEGMVRIGSFSGVRSSSLIGEIARLAKIHPATDAWLRAQQSEVEKRMRASASDSEAAREFASITASMDDRKRLLAVFDEFPPGDERRKGLGLRVYDDLLEARRYKDAAEARSYSLMNISMSSGDDNPRMREYVVTTAAKNIEVLAGAGDLERAQTLMKRLLVIDSSNETQALLLKHLTRAGQPQLLVAAPKL